MFFDTASLYFRSYFGLPSSMTAPDGMPVNAIRGLLDSMARLMDQYRPDGVVCAWDNDWRPTWRVDLVTSYKAHRVADDGSAKIAQAPVGAGGVGAASDQAEEAPEQLSVQVPWIRQVLDALGVPVIGVDDHEADDVLGSLARQTDGECWVVTGDRDLFQLASDRCRVVYVGRGVAKHELVDPAWVMDKYGVRPDQYVDFAVLRGDPSDGLPGVKGVGEKSAAQLIARHGSLEAIAQAASDPSSSMAPGLRAKLAAATDYLGPASVVVQVVEDLALPSVPRIAESPVDAERLAALDERLDLGGSLNRMLHALQACGARKA